MSESSTTDADSHTAHKSILERLTAFMRPVQPSDREEIKALLDEAHSRQVLDSESYTMISGALDVANQSAADIMIPRSRVDMLDISKPLSQLLPTIIETGHSRFPVYEDDRDNIVGILLSKDLLLSINNSDIDIATLIRPAIFVPETKKLNVLLRDFRSGRNHMAIVIDEHGGTSGIVTMEDVLEQIVGEIEDEYDEEEEKTIFQTGKNNWRAMAITDIDVFNQHFNTEIPDDDYDTIGGWLAEQLGHIPLRGDRVTHKGLIITIVGADAKRALWIHVQENQANTDAQENIDENSNKASN